MQLCNSLIYLKTIFVLTAALLIGLTTCRVHAAPPDAGTLLQEVRPEHPIHKDNPDTLPLLPPISYKPVQSDVKVMIRSIQITGAKTIPETVLHALVSDVIGHDLSLTQLDDVALRITRHYRKSGYLLARAYLPAQEIRDGVVRIAVLEGQLGKISINNRSRLAESTVTGHLDKIQAGQAITGDGLERELLLLSDLPGIEVRSTLKPGASVGTTDLDLQLADKSRYTGGLVLDNFGNSYSGEWRIGGNFTAGNLTSLGDTLSLRVTGSEGLAYGRLAWQVPVGSTGTQAGVAGSAMWYKLGKDFSSLDAHGTAAIGSFYLLHPFLRSRTNNLNGQLLYDYKQLDDDIDSTNTSTGKTINLITLGLSGNFSDGFIGGGISNWSLACATGHLDIDAITKTWDQAGHQTAGYFGKFNLMAGRIQGLTQHWSLAAFFKGQIATQNLDSAEKIALGGVDGVRAYPQGEAPSDDAWLATFELRRTIIQKLQASAFYDMAYGYLNHSPIPADGCNDRRLAGYGVGLTYADTIFSAQLVAAWRDGSPATSDSDRAPRIWFQTAIRF